MITYLVKIPKGTEYEYHGSIFHTTCDYSKRFITDHEMVDNEVKYWTKMALLIKIAENELYNKNRYKGIELYSSDMEVIRND